MCRLQERLAAHQPPPWRRAAEWGSGGPTRIPDRAEAGKEHLSTSAGGHAGVFAREKRGRPCDLVVGPPAEAASPSGDLNAKPPALLQADVGKGAGTRVAAGRDQDPASVPKARLEGRAGRRGE